MLHALGIIRRENATPSKLQKDRPMWQQECTTFQRIWLFFLRRGLPLLSLLAVGALIERSYDQRNKEA
jgi:hypothetical protein